MMDMHLVETDFTWIRLRQYFTPVPLCVARYMVATTGIFRFAGIASIGVSAW